MLVLFSELRFGRCLSLLSDALLLLATVGLLAGCVIRPETRMGGRQKATIRVYVVNHLSSLSLVSYLDLSPSCLVMASLGWTLRLT